MWPKGSPLDLNNLPEEYGKQAVEESSTTTAASTDSAKFKKKKNGSKEESGKVYECRFCSLKFCKSQALGGHMNRHRQERETETLNRARQLVYSNEGLTATGVHLGLRDLNTLGGAAPVQYSPNYTETGRVAVTEQCLRFPPLYPRLPVQNTGTGPIHPCIYPSSTTSPHPIPFPSSYHHSIRGDYYIGHVLPSVPPRPLHSREPSYTCFGAPLGHNLTMDRIRPLAMVQDGAATGNQMDGMNWNRSYGFGQHAGGDPSPDIDPSFP